MKQKQAKGFTLLEMMAVVAILGIVGAFVAPKITALLQQPRASNMVTLADSARDVLNQYNTYCGTPKTVSGSPLPASGKTIEDVVFGGDANLSSTFTPPTNNCSTRTGLKPLDKLAKKTSSGYSAEGYPVSLTDVTGGYTGTVFTTVPPDVLQEVLSKTSANASINASGDSTDSRVRYTAVSSGTHTVTILSK